MEAKTHVMLDLETLGTAPGSVIVSIGAVKFSAGHILSSFYAVIDPQSCVDAGLKMDAATVMWWMKQSEEARTALMGSVTHPSLHLAEVLQDLAIWMCTDLRPCIWGNGASFDCALLAAAFRACGRIIPWKYSSERCYRTVKALHSDVPEDPREGTHHHALADAKHQAMHLMKLLPNL